MSCGLETMCEAVDKMHRAGICRVTETRCGGREVWKWIGKLNLGPELLQRNPKLPHLVEQEEGLSKAL